MITVLATIAALFVLTWLLMRSTPDGSPPDSGPNMGE
jgi:hypothetical protein